jgi:hypothetical protein
MNKNATLVRGGALLDRQVPFVAACLSHQVPSTRLGFDAESVRTVAGPRIMAGAVGEAVAG